MEGDGKRRRENHTPQKSSNSQTQTPSIMKHYYNLMIHTKINLCETGDSEQRAFQSNNTFLCINFFLHDNTLLNQDATLIVISF